jgi:hypothetical protein
MICLADCKIPNLAVVAAEQDRTYVYSISLDVDRCYNCHRFSDFDFDICLFHRVCIGIGGTLQTEYKRDYSSL